MTNKTVGLLCMAGAGVGCAIGIPIGNSTAPAKTQRLAWPKFVDRWGQVTLALKNEIGKVDAIKEFEARHKEAWERMRQTDLEYRRNAQGSLGTESVELERLRAENLARPPMLSWDEKKAKELEEFNNFLEGMKKLENYPKTNKKVPEDVRQKINQAVESFDWIEK